SKEVPRDRSEALLHRSWHGIARGDDTCDRIDSELVGARELESPADERDHGALRNESSSVHRDHPLPHCRYPWQWLYGSVRAAGSGPGISPELHGDGPL